MTIAHTTRRIRLGAVSALAAAGLAAGAPAAAPAATTTCSVTGPSVCVDIADTPDPVSPSTASGATFLSYDVAVRNQAPSTVTHATLTDTLPAGSTLVSATPSAGTCSSSAGVVTCALGSRASGTTVTLRLVVRAPEASGSVSDSVTVSFDERTNDGATADPKQDTVAASEPTDVRAAEGSASSLVPPGVAVRLDTDPTRADVTSAGNPNIGVGTIPAQPAALPDAAQLRETSDPPICPAREVCRDGAWVFASIPGSFFPPLRFELHWNASIVPKKQTVKNLDVLHAHCTVLPCAVEVVSRRCSSADPGILELPCLFGVTAAAGEFKATLLSRDNGYMR